MLLTFDPFYNQTNINMAIQRVLNEMEEYKYIQFDYLQVMNINCMLFECSYCYPVFIYAYIIACKILDFSATVELIKKTLWPLFMDGVQLPQDYSHFEEAVYFLPLSSQKFLVLILSTSEG